MTRQPSTATIQRRPTIEGEPPVNDARNPLARTELPRSNSTQRGWEHWRDFERALEAAGKTAFPSVAEALDRDGGRFLTVVRLVARGTERLGLNLCSAGLVQRLADRATDHA